MNEIVQITGATVSDSVDLTLPPAKVKFGSGNVDATKAVDSPKFLTPFDGLSAEIGKTSEGKVAVILQQRQSSGTKLISKPLREEEVQTVIVQISPSAKRMKGVAEHNLLLLQEVVGSLQALATDWQARARLSEFPPAVVEAVRPREGGGNQWTDYACGMNHPLLS